MAKLFITFLFLVAMAVTVMCSDERYIFSSEAVGIFSRSQVQERRCKGLYEPCKAGECCYGFLCHNYDKKCRRPCALGKSGAGLSTPLQQRHDDAKEEIGKSSLRK